MSKNTNQYEVGYRPSWMHPDQEPADYHCMAKDVEHAAQMCRASNPDCEIVYVQLTDTKPLPTAEHLYGVLYTNGIDYEIVEVFDGVRVLSIPVTEEYEDD